MYEYTTSLKDRLEVVVLVSSRVEAGLTSQLSSIIILVTITIYYIAVIVIGIFIVIFINEYNINFFLIGLLLRKTRVLKYTEAE